MVVYTKIICRNYSFLHYHFCIKSRVSEKILHIEKINQVLYSVNIFLIFLLISFIYDDYYSLVLKYCLRSFALGQQTKPDLLIPFRVNHHCTLIPALPFCKVSLKGDRPPKPEYPKKLNTLGDHIRKKRLDLGLLQKEVALRIGRSEASVYNWENNRTSPALFCIQKIIKFLGYVPYHSKPKTIGEKLIAYRRINGISRKQFAHQLGVDPSTLARWEKVENQPSKYLLRKCKVFRIDL